LRYRARPWTAEFLYRYSRGVGVDVGCGAAATTRHLLEEGFLEKLILIDLAPEPLARARGVHVLKLCGDALELPLRDSVADTLYLLAVIHHIPGRECRCQALREAHRALKPGGSLIVTAWSPEPKALEREKSVVWLSERELLLRDRSGARYYTLIEKQELEELVEEAGFEIIESGVFTQNPSKPLLTRNTYVVARKS